MIHARYNTAIVCVVSVVVLTVDVESQWLLSPQNCSSDVVAVAIGNSNKRNRTRTVSFPVPT